MLMARLQIADEEPEYRVLQVKASPPPPDLPIRVFMDGTVAVKNGPVYLKLSNGRYLKSTGGSLYLQKDYVERGIFHQWLGQHGHIANSLRPRCSI